MKQNESRDKWDAKHFNKAKELVLIEGYASCKLLKTKLGLGDNKAGIIMDQLEDAGIVAPFEGRAKARSKTFPGLAKAMATQWGTL